MSKTNHGSPKIHKTILCLLLQNPILQTAVIKVTIFTFLFLDKSKFKKFYFLQDRWVLQMDQHLKRKRLQRLLLLQLLRKVRLLKPLSNDNESYGHFLIFQIMILPGLLEDPSEELAKRHHAANVTIFQKDKKNYMCYTLYFSCIWIIFVSSYFNCRATILVCLLRI